MGMRHSVAGNIVLTSSAPSEIIDQLDQLVAFTKDSALGKIIDDGFSTPEGFSKALVPLFRNHRAYGAVWDQRKSVVPGKHYVTYGTTKRGDTYVHAAVEFLEPYLDLEKSWFVSLYEGSEITVVRWKKIGNGFTRQELIADLYFETQPDPFIVGASILEEVDCQDIPWWFAEPIAKTLATRDFNKVLKRLTRLKLRPGKIVVRYPVLDPDRIRREGSYRHVYLNQKAKKGKGRKHYRISTFYPVIKINFTETKSALVTRLLDDWRESLTTTEGQNS